MRPTRQICLVYELLWRLPEYGRELIHLLKELFYRSEQMDVKPQEACKAATVRMAAVIKFLRPLNGLQDQSKAVPYGL